MSYFNSPNAAPYSTANLHAGIDPATGKPFYLAGYDAQMQPVFSWSPTYNQAESGGVMDRSSGHFADAMASGGQFGQLGQFVSNAQGSMYETQQPNQLAGGTPSLQQIGSYQAPAQPAVGGSQLPAPPRVAAPQAAPPPPAPGPTYANSQASTAQQPRYSGPNYVRGQRQMGGTPQAPRPVQSAPQRQPQAQTQPSGLAPNPMQQFGSGSRQQIAPVGAIGRGKQNIWGNARLF